MWQTRHTQTSPLGDAGDRFHGRRLAVVLAGALSLCFADVVRASDPFQHLRHDMVEHQIRDRGITESEVLSAMEAVPRHLFVPETNRPQAYDDEPVAIAPGQTLYQAYLSALLISYLDLQGHEKVLEVGTGSGYDAALLSLMAGEVYTIEIDEELGARAQETLDHLGYQNVRVRIGDGYRGWPEEAPFDAILLTAAPETIPDPLFDQLKVGGKMVVAVGRLIQDLQVITKNADGERETRKIRPVVMVPMTGEVNEQR